MSISREWPVYSTKGCVEYSPVRIWKSSCREGESKKQRNSASATGKRIKKRIVVSTRTTTVTDNNPNARCRPDWKGCIKNETIFVFFLICIGKGFISNGTALPL